jgi:hypothetical protein
MIIDDRMPEFDVRLAEHLIVSAPPTAIFAAARNLDFLTVHSPLLDAAMWVRRVPDRVRGRTKPMPTALRLAEGMGLPGWMMLGERPDDEIAFGAVGRFWQPSIEWRDVPPEQFTAFNQPGWGKIACNFTVRPYGDASTLVTYECRTATTDPVARRRFARYWWLTRPFIAHIMRATLATIAQNTTRVPAHRPVGV